MSNAVMSREVKGQAATRRGLKVLAAGVLLAISATVALSAWAHPGGGHHGGAMMGGGSALFMGGHGRGIERMLDSVNATEAQRVRIRQITQEAAQDLKAQREQHRALRERSLQIFTAPVVDAAAAEAVRKQMLAQHDATSSRMLKAMLEVSAELTPEQRAQLGERMKQRMQRMQERMEQRQQQAPKQ
jgi:protein CpxP